MLEKTLIGHRCGKRSIAVEAGAVRFYAQTIGETDLTYYDVAAARNVGLRSLRVPPTFLSCLEGRLFETRTLLDLAKMDLKRLLHAEQSYLYHAAACAGDTLTYEPQIVDIYDKKGGTVLASTEAAHAPLDVITATVDTANKVITFSIKSSDTSGFTWKKGVYEAEVYSNADDKQRIAEGEVTISRELPP